VFVKKDMFKIKMEIAFYLNLVQQFNVLILKLIFKLFDHSLIIFSAICSAAEHKVYTDCGAQCPIKTCDNPEGAAFCPFICVSGCICEDGYLQDSDGNCVAAEACPAIIRN
jgi:hypothetical protein